MTFNPTGLGLKSLAVGTDFIDNAVDQHGSDGAQHRQHHAARRRLRPSVPTSRSCRSVRTSTKNLINVLQTGSSNLTLADSNEEAANSQALSTRQSIAVSALSLANQSQQSVLQLLR